MTNGEIKDKIKATIDQFYHVPNDRYVKDAQLHFIGGVLQTALHLLPWDDYYSLKKYIFETHGYNPGGVADNQIGLDDMKEEWMDGETI